MAILLYTTEILILPHCFSNDVLFTSSILHSPRLFFVRLQRICKWWSIVLHARVYCYCDMLYVYLMTSSVFLHCTLTRACCMNNLFAEKQTNRPITNYLTTLMCSQFTQRSKYKSLTALNYLNSKTVTRWVPIFVRLKNYKILQHLYIGTLSGVRLFKCQVFLSDVLRWRGAREAGNETMKWNKWNTRTAQVAPLARARALY